MIGMHLIVDGAMGCGVNREEIAKILTELPSRIGMKLLSEPLIVKGGPENPGWTGVIIIEKSHIAIHTFDLDSLISIDVYSCKPFDAEEVLNYLKGSLPLERLSSRIIIRDLAKD